MTEKDIVMFEKVHQELVSLANESVSIPSLSFRAMNLSTTIFEKINGAREQMLRDLQQNNGPVAKRFRENGRINGLITAGNVNNAFAHTPNYLPDETYILALGSAKYDSECALTSQKINELLSKYISIQSYEMVHVSKRALDISDFKELNCGFILPTVYEVSGNNKKVRSVAKVDVKYENERVKFTITLNEANGSFKIVEFLFKIPSSDGCNLYAVQVYDALEGCTFQGLQEHVHFDDIRQIIEHYFDKNGIAPVEGNEIVEGSRLLECQTRLLKYFQDFTLPLIEKYKDQVPAEQRSNVFLMNGKNKNHSNNRWNREISLVCDLDGNLEYLEYHFFSPEKGHTQAGSIKKINVSYRQNDGLTLHHNNHKLIFTQSTFDFILDQLKNETFDD